MKQLKIFLFIKALFEFIVAFTYIQTPEISTSFLVLSLVTLFVLIILYKL